MESKPPLPGLREYLIVISVLTLVVVGIILMPGPGRQMRLYCGGIVVAVMWVATLLGYGIKKLISNLRSDRDRDDTSA